MTTPRHIYIHIGVTKTGSSALQAFLSSNAKCLDDIGITYPHPENKEIVTQGVCSGNILHVMQNRATLQRFRGSISELANEFLLPVITESIDDARNERVVLSGEFISGRLNRKTLDTLKQLSKVHRITIIVFVRDIYDHAVSAWKQTVKNGGNTRDLLTFVENARDRGKLQLLRLAPILEAGLEFRVINYDHHKDSLTRCFLNEIGVSEGDLGLLDLPFHRKNPSLSFWQAKTVVMSDQIVGLSRLSALLANRFRHQPDGRADPYFHQIDHLLLNAQLSLIRSFNSHLPKDQQLRDRPRADLGYRDVVFAEKDVAAIMQILREYTTIQPARRAPLSLEGLPDYFDPEEYMLRNPDVEASGMDAETHYMKHGQFERRIYKVRPRD